MELLKFDLPTGAKLTAWLHTENSEMTADLCKNRPAVIVCPGGAYIYTSARESDPVAQEFFAMGAQVFILDYSVGELAADKRPMEELARTVLMVRQNAARWWVDPQKIVAIGFSAGGHLVGSLGVHWDDPEIAERCGVADAKLLRPDGIILCYPVLSMIDGVTHQITKNTVMANTKEEESYWSLETQVKETTPPAFIWHTMEDSAVPVENSMMFASALRRNGVSCEVHLFPHGEHGMSVCTREVSTHDPVVRQWVPMCGKWLDYHFGPLGGI